MQFLASFYTGERRNKYGHLDITGTASSCLESLWGIKVGTKVCQAPAKTAGRHNKHIED